ncbi:MAG TPA: hypothetical protein VJY54_12500, partial [Lachnospiraceae bacterium]|nr:hypothetical protein [Lachnospiraceae bacterium]
MRIDSSTIGMESTRRYSSSTTKTSRFLVKDYSGNAAHQTGNLFGNMSNTLSAADAMKELSMKVESMRNNIRTNNQSTMDSFKQYTVRSILTLLFGIGKSDSIFNQDVIESQYNNKSLSLQETEGSALTLQNEFFYQESECTTFSTTGNVSTADGREISIQVEIAMSRHFTQYFSDEVQIMQVNTCDPLVLNFSGNAAELRDQKFYFDIDTDGKEDQISMLDSGSGYLALDQNGDNVINDGSELFGAKSGNGFRELAALDEDGNGWIDENDRIWSKLRIWCQNEDGSSSLYTFADKGVGAICLQNTNTDFSLNSRKNDTNGVIRRTGIFLYENGNVGTVQHLD